VINYLYCIDSGYNLQCFISINSLIKYNKSKLNIHIIHKNPETFRNYKHKILENKNVQLNIHKFKNNEYRFKINSGHLSEATYYRLFMGDYLNDDVKKLIYLDADVFAINKFSSVIDSTFQELKEKNLTLAALDVANYDGPLTKEPYFNAGVLFIDYDKWLEENISTKLKNNIEEDYEYHDQDMLNKYFSNKFLNINKWLNMHVVLEDHVFNKDLIEKEAYFVHYVGKTKPWNIEGMIKLNSYFYHELIKEFNNGYLGLSKPRLSEIINFILKIRKTIFSKNFIYYVKNLLKINNNAL